MRCITNENRSTIRPLFEWVEVTNDPRSDVGCFPAGRDVMLELFITYGTVGLTLRVEEEVRQIRQKDFEVPGGHLRRPTQRVRS